MRDNFRWKFLCQFAWPLPPRCPFFASTMSMWMSPMYGRTTFSTPNFSPQLEPTAIPTTRLCAAKTLKWHWRTYPLSGWTSSVSMPRVNNFVCSTAGTVMPLGQNSRFSTYTPLELQRVIILSLPPACLIA